MTEASSGPSDSPLVSVIIIFLNAGRFIREAIESVFSQTYRDWELLLVDDGSTDSSTQIALSYAETHPGRVRYLDHAGHRNLGMSATRNAGAHAATGFFFAFLDSDDVWLPQKLEEQVAILKSHPEAGMVFGACEYWHSWLGQGGAPEPDAIPDLGVPGDMLYQPPELLVSVYPLGDGAAPCPSDLMLRRSAFIRAGGFQEEFRGIYSLYEDQAFLTKVYLNEAVFVSGSNWTRYRIHPDSCMSKVKGAGEYPAVRLYFLNYLERYLAGQGLGDVRIWTLLRKALLQFGRSVSIDGVPDADKRGLKWQLRTAHGNNASLAFPPDDSERIRITISRLETRDPWDIQLNQTDLVVTGGQAYHIAFHARAEGVRTAGLGFSMAHAPWEGLGFYREIELTPEWRTHTFEFAASADDHNARVHFDLGGSGIAVELESVAVHRLTDGQPLEANFIIHGQYPVERWSELTKTATRENGLAAPKAEVPRFSVVIPTYQRRELVIRTVAAFGRQCFDGDFEVIVVVDGSKDDSGDSLRALRTPFPITVLEQPNQGASAARNLGASIARGEILLFLDDDMEPHPGLLAEHDRSYSEGADVVTGHYPLHPGSPANFLSRAIKAWAEARARQLSQPGYALTTDDLLSGQISMKREIFQELQGFDTNFTSQGTYGDEDMEMGYRLLASGCNAVFNPYALSYQNYIITPRRHLGQVMEAGRAHVAFARKHPDQAALLFAPHLKGRSVRSEVWRALAALRPWSAPLTAALRAIALALVEHNFDGPKAERLFFEIYEMEFWRGVREAGGMPPIASVHVLAYHAIRDLGGEPVLDQYGTPPDQFRRQMRALQRCGFHFIGVDQFLGFLKGRSSLPRLPVLLTFDDCYSDLLEYALPILRELNIPAAAFAVSDRVGDSNTWDTVTGARRLPLLDAAGLAKVAAGGVEIGAHSRTHCRLPQASEKDLEDEVAGSVAELEARGLIRPRLFAYPGGEWNPLVRRAVRDAGLQGAFTTDYGRAREGWDPYLIPRIEIFRKDTGWRFLWKVIGAS